MCWWCHISQGHSGSNLHLPSAICARSTIAYWTRVCCTVQILQILNRDKNVLNVLARQCFSLSRKILLKPLNKYMSRLDWILAHHFSAYAKLEMTKKSCNTKCLYIQKLNWVVDQCRQLYNDLSVSDLYQSLPFVHLTCVRNIFKFSSVSKSEGGPHSVRHWKRQP